MGTMFAAVCREFTLRYAGLSFYWAWVFLSFNSLDIVSGGGESLSFVHAVSSVAAMVTFALCALRYRSILTWSRGRTVVVLVGLGIASGAGTFLYASPLFENQLQAMCLGAAVSGLTCSPIVLAWGAAYRGLDARRAVLFTAMTFFGAAVLYIAVTQLGSVLSPIAVSLFPLCAAATVAYSLHDRLGKSAQKDSGTTAEGVSKGDRPQGASELGALIRSAFSWRVLVGLLASYAAYGGLRIYFGSIAPSVFSNAVLMAAPIALAALIFLAYSRFVSRTSLNLGVLYRISMSVWALAFVLIALLGHGNASAVFFVVSLCSVLFEVLTWALLVEITRTTHFSALLVFAVGRLVVHLGIVLGELVAFAFIGDVIVFSIAAICVLLVSIGFTFTDRDTTFLFENPTPEELNRLVGDERRETCAVVATSLRDGTVQHSASSCANLEKLAFPPAGMVGVGTEGALVPAALDIATRIDALAGAYQLSPREREVFTLWVTGHGSKYIQEKFVISPATVKTHVRHIYEKCDVHNRAELMNKLEES